METNAQPLVTLIFFWWPQSRLCVCSLSFFFLKEIKYNVTIQIAPKETEGILTYITQKTTSFSLRQFISVFIATISYIWCLNMTSQQLPENTFTDGQKLEKYKASKFR